MVARGCPRRLRRALQTQHQLDQLLAAQALEIGTTHSLLGSGISLIRKGMGNYPHPRSRRREDIMVAIVRRIDPLAYTAAKTDKLPLHVRGRMIIAGITAEDVQDSMVTTV
jgi:hypothetical protein